MEATDSAEYELKRVQYLYRYKYHRADEELDNLHSLYVDQWLGGNQWKDRK